MATNFKGVWNANTNTPTLASGVGTTGDQWIVSVTGTTDLDGETGWLVGDSLFFSGTFSIWERVPSSAPVTSVNTEVGVVVLDAADIAEVAPNQLYLTQAERDALANKSDVGHPHVEADITNLDKYTQAAVDSLLANKLANLEDDPTPTAGGDIDMAGFDITNTGTDILADLNIASPNGSLKLGTDPLNKTEIGYEATQHGNVIINSLAFPFKDGTPGQALATDGNKKLDFTNMPDMDTSIYDANNDGIVDSADSLKFKAQNDNIAHATIPETMTVGTCVYPQNKTIGEILRVRTASLLFDDRMPAVGIVVTPGVVGVVVDVVSTGLVEDLDTSLFLIGDDLYVDNIGQITNIKPVFGFTQRIGKVVLSHPSEGAISVSFIRGEDFRLDDDLSPQLSGTLDTRGHNITSGLGLILNGFMFPSADAPAFWVLATNGEGTLVFRAPGAGSGLGSVSEDPSPSAGGDFDMQANDIFSTGPGVTINGIRYPAADGLTDHVMTTNGAGILTLKAIPNLVGWITELFEDLTPTLAGPLDVNDQDINGGVTINSLVYPTADGLAGWVMKTDGAGVLSLVAFAHTHLQADVTGLESRLTTHEARTTFIESDYITDSVINHSGALGGSANTIPSEAVVNSAINSKITASPFVHRGVWDASTNTPTLVSGVGTASHKYTVSVAGSTNLDGISTWAIGDIAVFNGPLLVWEKIPNTGNVASINALTGAVVLDADGIGETAARVWFTPAKQIDLDQKTDTGHAHVETDVSNLDKFTQAEVNALLALKAALAHTHLEVDVTDLDRYTQAQVDGFLTDKAAAVHVHLESDVNDLDKYTQDEVDASLAFKSDSTHNHGGFTGTVGFTDELGGTAGLLNFTNGIFTGVT